jgi:hypothetical protein
MQDTPSGQQQSGILFEIAVKAAFDAVNAAIDLDAK